MWFTCRMSTTARFLLFAGVVFGVFGTSTYLTDTWIRGDGVMRSPSAFAGTCLGIGLLLVAIGLRLVMRDKRRVPRR